MGRALGRVVAWAATLVAPALLAPGAPAAPTLPTGEPMAIEATPLVPLDDESALSVIGLTGQISIETHDERELRVVSRELGPDGAERPVAIWADGNRLIVGPAPGDRSGPRQMRIEIPNTFAVAIDATGSDLALQSVGGGIELRGKDVRAAIQGSAGSITATLEGGSLKVGGSRDATLTLRGVVVEFNGMSGNVNVRAAGGTVVLNKVDGPIDVESQESKLVMEGGAGSIHVKARKGDVTVIDNGGAAELELAGTGLHLRGGKGEITVTSDDSVEFSAMLAAMRLEMLGGSIKGKGNQGSLDVRARNTEIEVGSIEQGVHVSGDGLRVRIDGVGGEVSVENSFGEIVVQTAGSAIVKADRGNVTLQGVLGAVSATVTGGDVHIIDGNGPVTLDLDGGDAQVSWASLSGDKDSKLTNKSGNITVKFPVAGGCRVEAKSTYGGIDSDLPTVRVMEGSKEAQGPVNGGYRPVVHVVATGDVHLQNGAVPHDDQ